MIGDGMERERDKHRVISLAEKAGVSRRNARAALIKHHWDFEKAKAELVK